MVLFILQGKVNEELHNNNNKNLEFEAFMMHAHILYHFK